MVHPFRFIALLEDNLSRVCGGHWQAMFWIFEKTRVRILLLISLSRKNAKTKLNGKCKVKRS